MGNIIVTSGGFNTINNNVSDENIKFFKKLANGKRVLIVANAAPEGSGNYVARENVKNNFYDSGAIKVDVVDLDENNINIILNYDIIYCLGGNVIHLIKLNNTTPFKELLIRFLEKGIYIGESAGSMILADNLKYAYDILKETKPKFNVELESYSGLGLIDDHILPHFQRTAEEAKRKADDYEVNNKIKVTRLKDGEIIAFRYENNKSTRI